jgi:hypothetical protein
MGFCDLASVQCLLRVLFRLPVCLQANSSKHVQLLGAAVWHIQPSSTVCAVFGMPAVGVAAFNIVTCHLARCMWLQGDRRHARIPADAHHLCEPAPPYRGTALRGECRGLPSHPV